jgi:hypothetical protein
MWKLKNLLTVIIIELTPMSSYSDYSNQIYSTLVFPWISVSWKFMTDIDKLQEFGSFLVYIFWFQVES